MISVDKKENHIRKESVGVRSIGRKNIALLD